MSAFMELRIITPALLCYTTDQIGASVQHVPIMNTVLQHWHFTGGFVLQGAHKKNCIANYLLFLAGRWPARLQIASFLDH